MPSRKIHNLISKLLLGDEFNEVHEMKDKLWPLLGSKHRVFGHDPFSNIIIASFSKKDPVKALAAAILHDFMDQQLVENHGIIKRRKSKSLF